MENDGLVKYIVENCIRCACTCGKYIDTVDNKFQPDGHTVDVQFFKVTLKNSNGSRLTDADKDIIKKDLIQLIKNHVGIHKDIDILDGNEHDLIEIGGWIGSHSAALMLMGMGELLGMWNVVTPNRIASDFSEETRKMLADAGFITIRYKEWQIYYKNGLIITNRYNELI